MKLRTRVAAVPLLFGPILAHGHALAVENAEGAVATPGKTSGTSPTKDRSRDSVALLDVGFMPLAGFGVVKGRVGGYSADAGDLHVHAPFTYVGGMVNLGLRYEPILLALYLEVDHDLEAPHATHVVPGLLARLFVRTGEETNFVSGFAFDFRIFRDDWVLPCDMSSCGKGAGGLGQDPGTELIGVGGGMDLVLRFGGKNIRGRDSVIAADFAPELVIGADASSLFSAADEAGVEPANSIAERLFVGFRLGFGTDLGYSSE